MSFNTALHPNLETPAVFLCRCKPGLWEPACSADAVLCYAGCETPQSYGGWLQLVCMLLPELPNISWPCLPDQQP